MKNSKLSTRNVQFSEAQPTAIAVLLLLAGIGGCGSANSVTHDPETDAVAALPISIDLGVINAGEKHLREISVFNGTTSPLSVADVKVSCGCLSLIDDQVDVLPNKAGTWHISLSQEREPGTFSQQIRMLSSGKDASDLWTKHLNVSGCTSGSWVTPTAVIVAPDRPGLMAVCWAGEGGNGEASLDCSKDLNVTAVEISEKSLRLVGLEPKSVRFYEIETHLVEISLKASAVEQRKSFVIVKSRSGDGRKLRVPVSIRK